MTKTATKIRFRARLFRPAATAKGGSWTLLTLPKNASAKLPSGGRTMVEGTINGFPLPFRLAIEQDGQGSHRLRLNRPVREAAGVDAGDVVTVEIAPVGEGPEPRVPADLRKALAAVPEAQALWSGITPLARRDWILWLDSAKRADTRARRIDIACSKLAAGKRRPCCFNKYNELFFRTRRQRNIQKKLTKNQGAEASPSSRPKNRP